MARVRVEIDEKAIGDYFRTDPLAQAALLEAAEAYREAAREATPRGHSVGTFKTIGKGPRRIIVPAHPRTGGGARHGWAAAAFHVRPFRGGFRVYNRFRMFHLIEYGSVNNVAYAPMRRALMAMTGGRTAVKAASSTGVRSVEGEHTF